MSLDFVTKEFVFLQKEYSFTDPIGWNWGRELHWTYFKKNLYVDIAFDGVYMVSVGRTKIHNPELISGKTKLSEIPVEDRDSYDVELLIPREIRFPFSFSGKYWTNLTPIERTLLHEHRSRYESQYYSLSAQARLLRENPQVLKGDWKLFYSAKKGSLGFWLSIKNIIRRLTSRSS